VEVPVSSRDRFGALLGGSPAMRRVFAILERISPTDTTLLVEGETGTGKELVAEGVHEESQRSGGPFVVFDCSAVSPNLIESELFGHVKGSFTGAIADRAGKFEQANRGTLFLDEIGDMSLAAQAKVLRVLEDNVLTRIGGSKPVSVDVRVIAATNKNLELEIGAGRFREDLYYRLNVVPVHVPPLRERREDIPVLAEYFLTLLTAREGIIPRTLSRDAIERLSALDWPGNVRELRNTVERLLILASNSEITARDVDRLSGQRTLDDTGLASLSGCKTFEEFKDAAERAFLLAKLREFEWNVSETARAVEMPRSNLYKKIERYSLTRETT
jgi:two-component system, NtrC family, nitrogen regulation response regulator NtrX